MKKFLVSLFTVFCLGTTFANAEASLDRVFQEKKSDVQVSGSGKVMKILPDDKDGNRHQKFILKLSSNLTILVAHNIDLAQRIEDLKAGDEVSFYGEYEWNKQGGLVHWTHHDPSKKHKDGWLKHKGKIYQ